MRRGRQKRMIRRERERERKEKRMKWRERQKRERERKWRKRESINQKGTKVEEYACTSRERRKT